jgi:hypothetical protein
VIDGDPGRAVLDAGMDRKADRGTLFGDDSRRPNC